MRIVVMTLICLLFASTAVAGTLTWNRNTESDMKDYQVYRCATLNPCTKAAGVVLGTVLQTPSGPTVSFPVAASVVDGFAMVTARDQANNESVESNTVNFNIAPSAPGNLIYTP